MFSRVRDSLKPGVGVSEAAESRTSNFNGHLITRTLRRHLASGLGALRPVFEESRPRPVLIAADGFLLSSGRVSRGLAQSGRYAQFSGGRVRVSGRRAGYAGAPRRARPGGPNDDRATRLVHSGRFSGWNAYAHIEVGSMIMKTTPLPHSAGARAIRSTQGAGLRAPAFGKASPGAGGDRRPFRPSLGF